MEKTHDAAVNRYPSGVISKAVILLGTIRIDIIDLSSIFRIFINICIYQILNTYNYNERMVFTIL